MPAISVRGLSKRYLISHLRREGYATLRDRIDAGLKGAVRLLSPRSSSPPSAPELEEFWALKDVEFDVSAGDRIGIIGRNGAGKSTLLKILSRITAPTSGRIEIRGRVASLLEVGTGFHPELSGRENIYLNGVIMGMSRQEVRARFDRIVEFADLAQFLDTPVKRYSSGMYVRLAFAVAAHLDPEVLIVDEVLAVGDWEFQRKCLGKLEQIGSQGTTLLFVSHNMGAVDAICDKAILLERGKVVKIGPAKETTFEYLRSGQSPAANLLAGAQHPNFRFKSVALRTERGSVPWVEQDESFTLTASFEVFAHLSKVEVGISLFRDEARAPLLSTVVSECPEIGQAVEYAPGMYEASLRVEGGMFAPGSYSVSLYAHSPFREHYDKRPFVLVFEIKRGSHYDIAKYSDSQPGLVSIPPQWTLQKTSR